VMERDLFKAQAAARKVEAQLKTLKELSTIHGVTHNNTSSAFTLPSEFKTLWDELVTELILDAYPDFLGQYKQIVPLV
jgi:predicted nucleic acid-binding protein